LLLAFLITAVMLTASTSCGVKKSPTPPAMNRPKPPGDFKAELSPEGVLLSCVVPERYENGEVIKGLEAVEFFRAKVPKERACPSCPLRFIKVGEATLRESFMGPGARTMVGFVDREVSEGLYKYKAVARDERGARSRPTAALEVYWSVPPERVTGLRAQLSDGGILLSWEPVRKTLDGRPIKEVKYQVFKAQRGSTFPRTPLNKRPLEITKFMDRRVRKGLVYLYRVRAVRFVEGHPVQGPFSDPLEVSTVDIKAPLPPKGVVAFLTAKGVRVVWEASQSPDVKGYRIYRAQDPEGPWRLVSPPLVPTVLYDDMQVEAGLTYWYAVTAVDEAVPPNESPLSRPARVVIPKGR
jgi:hypothetical protein